VAVNAAKGVANQVQGAVLSFVSNFQMAINPQITKNYAANDYQRVHFLIKQGTRFSIYLFLILSMPIMLETEMILNIWLVKVPEYSVIFVRLAFMYILIDTFYHFTIVAITATGRMKKYILVVGSTKILALPLTYLFLKLGGNPTTGLWVVIFLEVICVFLHLYLVRDMVKLDIKDFLKEVIAKSLLVIMAASILPLITKFNFVCANKYLYLSTITAISLCSCGLSIYYLGLLPTEKQMLKNMLRKSLKNFNKYGNSKTGR
jgi:O-antigen/teichoic acid export membrane protein